MPSGAWSAQRLTDNLQGYLIPDTLSFKEKAVQWFRDLLLRKDKVDDMTGFDNSIMMVYRMCPPCTLMEYYQIEQDQEAPTHFMKETAEEVWGNDAFEIMRRTAEVWTD
jgi:hypothetical protein